METAPEKEPELLSETAVGKAAEKEAGHTGYNSKESGEVPKTQVAPEPLEKEAPVSPLRMMGKLPLTERQSVERQQAKQLSGGNGNDSIKPYMRSIRNLKNEKTLKLEISNPSPLS